jgi:hypothetical protein
MKIMSAEKDFEPKSNILVHEETGLQYSLLRAALQNKGIKVLKYTNSNKSITNIKKNEIIKGITDIKIEEYQTTEYMLNKTPYIIAVYGNIEPFISCVTSSDPKVHSIRVEITDFDTKEVVFIARAKGFDEPCGYCRKCVFDDMADKIAEFFKTKNK